MVFQMYVNMCSTWQSHSHPPTPLQGFGIVSYFIRKVVLGRLFFTFKQRTWNERPCRRHLVASRAERLEYFSLGFLVLTLLCLRICVSGYFLSFSLLSGLFFLPNPPPLSLKRVSPRLHLFRIAQTWLATSF